MGCIALEFILSDGEQATRPRAPAPALPAARPTAGSRQHPQAPTAMPWQTGNSFSLGVKVTQATDGAAGLWECPLQVTV